MRPSLKKLSSSTALLVSLSFLGIGEKGFASSDMTEELKRVSSSAMVSGSREEVLQDQPSPSLPNILKGLMAPDMDILTRAQHFNPSGLLTQFHQELRGITSLTLNKEQAIYDAAVKGMWALYFHHFMTGEILVDKGKGFLETLRESASSPVASSSMAPQGPHKKNKLSKNAKAASSATIQKPKKLFSHISKANGDQRDLLERLYLKNFHPNDMSEILGKFFGLSSSIVSKKVIEDTSRGFAEEIKDLHFSFNGQSSKPILHQENSDGFEGPFLRAGIYFRAPWALQECKNLWVSYLNLQDNIEAEKWLSLGVDAEHLDSMHMLAVMKKEYGDLDSSKALHLKVIQAANLTPLRTNGERISYHQSLFNLALQEHNERNFDKAREYYHILVHQNHLEGIYNLAILEYETGHTDDAKRLYQLAAERGHLKATDNLAIMEYYDYLGAKSEADRQKHKNVAKEALRKAIAKKFYKSNLLMARILLEEENFIEAEKFLKQAISFGVKNAELAYAQFLHERSRVEEAQRYLDLYEESLPEADRLKDEEESISTQELPENDHPFLETKSSSVIPDLVIVPFVSAEKNHQEKPMPAHEPEAAPSAGLGSESVERYVAPAIPKRLQKYLVRAEAEEKAELQQRTLNVRMQTRHERTYQDVEIKVLPKSMGIFRTHGITIQGLISRLSNGEKPNDFEKLKGHDDIYSMRLGRVGRVIFRVTEWRDNAVSALTLLSIDDHYETLKSVVHSTTQAKLMTWE